MIIDEDNYLAHYGILRRSGRYPWGSGGTVEIRSRDFLSTIAAERKAGMSDTEIAKGHGMTTTEFRNLSSVAKNAKRAADVSMATRLRDKGMSNVAIGARMKIPESSVRALLAPGLKDRLDILHNTADMLRREVAQKRFIDVGSGVEYHLNLSREKLDTAISVLKEEGYQIHKVSIEQAFGVGKTTTKVLIPPGVTYKELYANRHQIQQIQNYTVDSGRTFLGIAPPLSISSKRVGINYAEDGGRNADGVIYVRRGVPEVSIGGNHYAQVRVAVDGTHYIKGMAMYKDDLPPGVDLVFNTNKSNTGNKLDALKPLKRTPDGNIDPDNPFGSAISRQIIEVSSRGKERVTSVMNMVNEEGDWETWSKNLSSQFLSKQTPKLAKQQLDMTFERRKNELNSILELTNPAVRKTLLDKFADGTDAAAVHLKAAALPRVSNHVLLPLHPDKIKETEIYAPNFKNGDHVVLVRHPHGGVFEIPELVVNNRNPEGRSLIGNHSIDAVGIHPKVAEKLSGADFDGDTVLVIRNNQRDIKTAPSLEGLKNFDPKRTYAPYDGMKTIDGGHYDAKTGLVDYGGKRPSPRNTQTEMGKISNLITDMTIKAAPNTELARAVRHSMVVIDAEKHHLNYRESEIANGIKELRSKYQKNEETGRSGGAATLISRKKQEIDVPQRKARTAAKGGPVDKSTGKLMFEPTGATRRGKNGVEVPVTQKAKRILEVHDVHELSSGTHMEGLYADHSNSLKSLANTARLESLRTKSVPYSPSAKKAYAKEVESLNGKLRLALRNRPLERQAQLLTDHLVTTKVRDNPDMQVAEIKKLRAQALEEMRTRTGAGKKKIEFTPDEWKAIQAGAVSNHSLTEMLKNADLDTVKKLATPQRKLLMTSTNTARAKSMLASGYTQAEVADQLGVSLTTLKTALSGGE